MYDVNVLDRVKTILGDDYRLTDDDSFTYEWRRGYEVVTVQHVNGGGMEYRGSYHPNVVCEGNPCVHCGKASYE